MYEIDRSRQEKCEEVKRNRKFLGYWTKDVFHKFQCTKNHVCM